MNYYDMHCWLLLSNQAQNGMGCGSGLLGVTSNKYVNSKRTAFILWAYAASLHLGNVVKGGREKGGGKGGGSGGSERGDILLPSFVCAAAPLFPNHMYTLLCVHVHQVSSFENGGGPIFEGGSIFGASEAWL